MTKRPPLTADQVEDYRLRSLAEFGPRIQACLEPGETLRAVSYASIVGVRHPPRRYLPKASGKIWELIDRTDDALSGLDNLPSDAFFGLISFLARIPPSFKGGWKSQAGRFIIAVSAAAKLNSDTSRHLFLAVTDRRLLVLVPPRHFTSRSRDPAQVVGAYAPGHVGLRTEQRRGAGDGEVVLGYPDRSYAQVTLRGFPSSRSGEWLDERRAAAAVLSRFLPAMTS